MRDLKLVAAGAAAGMLASWTAFAMTRFREQAATVAPTVAPTVASHGELEQLLIPIAMEAKKNAACKSSGYAVGAALACGDGSDMQVFKGVNYESDSYGLCHCAERTALAAAFTAGKNTFTGMAVVSQKHILSIADARTQLCRPPRMEVWFHAKYWVNMC